MKQATLPGGIPAMFRKAVFLLTTAISCAAAEPPVTGSTTPPQEPMSVWFAAPARVMNKPRVPIAADGSRTPLAEEARKYDFHESLPLGNGRLGAMDCGGIDLLRVILNESSVWSGGDYDANKHDAWKSLPEIREKLFAGDIAGAQSVLNKNFGWVGKRFDATQFGCYQTLGDLIVKFPDSAEPATDYRRDLNLVTGLATTTYTRGTVKFTRELLVSKPAEIIALRLTADRPGALEFLATLARPAQTSVKSEKGVVTMHGTLPFDWPGGKGVNYQAKLAAKTKGGKIETTPEGLLITGADEAVLYLSAGTDLRDKDYEKLLVSRFQKAAAIPFPALRDAASADHAALMNRCRLELPATAAAKLPTPDRVKQLQKTPDPTLEALYFQFGRHLLVSSSRADSPLPANLQGIWAEETKTPWNGDFHSNINLQMNYWLAEPTNLSECHLPLIDLIRRTVEKGRTTANAYYNAPGWLCFHTQNPWGFSAPSNLDAGSGSTCGGWLAQHVWLHYLYTRDAQFLKENYPVLRGASEFFLATLATDPKTGKLVTAPSNSPENKYSTTGSDGKPINTSLTYGVTYDMQIIRNLFQNTAAAARFLKTDNDFVSRLEAARAMLAPTRTGADGRILEWIEDYKETEPKHRHVSHLWGLHPGNEITPATPDLFAGARKTLERRGDASTGWSMAWKANFWARLHDGARARKLLSMLIARGAPNLFCTHPPFQIDGNFGGTSAVAEMLLQSQETGENGTPVLDILPALPPEWPEGKITGLRARGGFTVDITWKDGKPTAIRLSSDHGIPVILRSGGKETTLTPAKNSPIKLNASLKPA